MSENVVIKRDRTVTVPASEAKIGVQYDHNVNVITFDCPRYPDDDRNVDMSTMQIYINYMLPDKTLGSYLAENVKVDANNPDTIHFDWKITRNVTQVKGALQALVCIKKVDAEGNELYHWNTDLIQSFRVGEGMECLETISSDYADVISQLLVNMNTVVGEFEALSADVTARTSEETLQGLVNNAASDEKLGSIVNAYMEANPVGINVDDTLTVSGDAADAKITGDRISELKSDLDDKLSFVETITNLLYDDYANEYYTTAPDGKTLVINSSKEYAGFVIDVNAGEIYSAYPESSFQRFVNENTVIALAKDCKIEGSSGYVFRVPEGANKLYFCCSADPSILSKSILAKGIYDFTDGVEEFPFGVTKSKLTRELYSTEGRDIDDIANNYIKTTILEVSLDGSKDYTSIVDAVSSIKDSNKFNRYEIRISEGTYDIMEECGGDTWLSSISLDNGQMQGLLLPDYVDLIGVGDREKIILKGHIDDSIATVENTTAISTLNLTYNNKIKNITISSMNQRYSVHDESNNTHGGYVREFENCIIEHLGNKNGVWSSFHTLGCGSGSDCEYIYRNCVFRNKVTPYLMHGNSGQKNVRLYFYNCVFESTKNYYEILLANAKSQNNNYAEFNNCVFSGIKAEDKWVVTGGGNSDYINAEIDNGNIRFSNEIKFCKNNSGSDMSKGTPVKLDTNTIAPVIGNKWYKFYGVTIEDIPNGSCGYVKTNGIIDITDILPSAQNGDMIGCNSGKLAVVSENPNGVCYEQSGRKYMIIR